MQSIKSKLGNLQKKVNEVMRITSLLERAMLVTMVCEVWRGGVGTPVELCPASAPPCTTAPPACDSAFGSESGRKAAGENAAVAGGWPQVLLTLDLAAAS